MGRAASQGDGGGENDGDDGAYWSHGDSPEQHDPVRVQGTSLAWTASSRWMRPSGNVVVGGVGAGWGGFDVGEAVVDGDGVAGWTAAEWAVQPVTAMAAAKMMAMTVRTGRMASSPGAA